MKNFLIIVLLGLSTMVYAQEKQKKTPEERATAITAWMKNNLKLTPEQELKVQDINLKYANKNQELTGSQAPKMKKAKAAKANDQAKDAELKTVLTDDQFSTYQAKKEDLKKKMKQEMQERKQNG